MYRQTLVQLEGAGTSRNVTLTPSGAWCQVLDRNTAIRKFLATSRWQGATRRFLEGDASFRRYETLHVDDAQAILMDMRYKAGWANRQGWKAV